MPDLTDYAKNLLGRALCARAPALPTQVFLALGTGGSDSTGLTGEPAGNGYARQRVTFSGTGPQQNTDAVRFTFTAGVGTVTHAGLFDAATGGTPAAICRSMIRSRSGSTRTVTRSRSP